MYEDVMKHLQIDKYRELIIKQDQKIADLEKACEETQELLDKQIEATYRLDKENAELKGLVNQYKASKCSGISMVNRNMIMSDQLTKAKELLKRCYENYIYLEPLRSEIEQFLSEVEK